MRKHSRKVRGNTGIIGDLRGIESHEVKAREHETAVLYFAVAATIVAVMGTSFVHNLPIRISEIISVIALIWLLAACYFLYVADRLATEKERLVAERVILAFAMVATVFAIYGVSVSFIQDTLLSAVSEVVALMWLVGASFFLYRSTKASGIAMSLREKHELVGKEIEYVDDQKRNTRLFVSEMHGLRGRPDYVVSMGENRIPVEVKTGRTPRGPLFSHIVQLGAYCLLIEEETAKAPPYGILRYERMEHEIEYSHDLKQIVLTKLSEMRSTLATGEAHRNHNRPGKCIGCSRRSVCPERLA